MTTKDRFCYLFYFCPLENHRECGGIIVNNTGLIMSPDYNGDGMYDDYLACHWTIVVESKTFLHLFILELSVEDDSSCKYDNLKVISSIVSKSKQI